MKRKKNIKREDLIGTEIDGIKIIDAYENPAFHNPNYQDLHGKRMLMISGYDSKNIYHRRDIVIK